MTKLNGWRISAIAGIVVAAALIGGAVALSAFGGSTVTTITTSGARSTVPVQQAQALSGGDR